MRIGQRSFRAGVAQERTAQFRSVPAVRRTTSIRSIVFAHDLRLVTIERSGIGPLVLDERRSRRSVSRFDRRVDRPAMPTAGLPFRLEGTGPPRFATVRE